MMEFARRAVEAATRAGAGYADARSASRQQESIQVKNGKVEALGSSTESGFGVRALVDGAWGFAASSRLDEQEAERVAELAVRIARASARTVKEKAELSPADPVRDRWESQFKTDPFEVPLDDKISLLLDADQRMRQVEGVDVSQASLTFFREHKFFVSSEGSEIEQRMTESGGMIEATAVEGTELQERSFPSSLEGFHAAGGYEVVESLGLVEGAEKTGREAVELLSAPVCPSGEMPVIIEGSHLALQVHESCGHPIELDRVFGSEASYAGTSFLTPDKLGSFRYGSDLVNLTADATLPGGLGSFGWDDEGVPSSRTEIVKNGIFRGYLTSRETAARLNLPLGSNGSMRADGWDRIPLIRMTNINLEPGDWELDELIAETGRGIWLETTKSWSIDDLRLNFQFATQVGRLIEDGALGGLIRNPTYQGITPEFWGSCDAVTSRKHWRLWGVRNCAKGEPVQLAHVGHGASPTRFSRVRVGVLEK